MRFLSLTTPISIVIQRLEARHLAPGAGHWHHISGVGSLALTLAAGPARFNDTTLVILSDDGEHRFDQIRFRWANVAQTHQSPRWRLSFKGHLEADAGDLLAVILRRDSSTLAAFIAPERSTWESQLVSLTGDPSPATANRVYGGESLPEVGYLAVSEIFDLAAWDFRTAQLPDRQPHP